MSLILLLFYWKWNPFDLLLSSSRFICASNLQTRFLIHFISVDLFDIFFDWFKWFPYLCQTGKFALHNLWIMSKFPPKQRFFSAAVIPWSQSVGQLFGSKCRPVQGPAELSKCPKLSPMIARCCTPPPRARSYTLTPFRSYGMDLHLHLLWPGPARLGPTHLARVYCLGEV